LAVLAGDLGNEFEVGVVVEHGYRQFLGSSGDE
jgi:hypothetical protein